MAVVKLNLEWFQGADASEPLVVTDDHGVIFLSSVPAWKYHTMRPLPRPSSRRFDLPGASVRAAADRAAAGDDRTHARRQRADRAHRRRPLCAALSGVAARHGRAGLASDHDVARRSGRRRRAQGDHRHRASATCRCAARVLLANAPRARARGDAQPRAAAKGLRRTEPASGRAHRGSFAGERTVAEGSGRTHARRAGLARRARRAHPGEQARRARSDGGRHHARTESAARRAARFLGQHARAARTRRPGGGARKSRSDRRAHRAHGQDHQSVETVRRTRAAAQCARTDRARALRNVRRDVADAHAGRRGRIRFARCGQRHAHAAEISPTIIPN